MIKTEAKSRERELWILATSLPQITIVILPANFKDLSGSDRERSSLLSARKR